MSRNEKSYGIRVTTLKTSFFAKRKIMEENTVFFCHIPTGLGTMESKFIRKPSKFTVFSHFHIINPALFHCICLLLCLVKKPI